MGLLLSFGEDLVSPYFAVIPRGERCDMPWILGNRSKQ